MVEAHTEHLPSSSDHETESDREREATELEDYEVVECNNNGVNRWPAHRSKNDEQKRLRAFKAFWRRQVMASVPHDQCRDHFGTHV